jgi:hypothetical protein
MERLKILFQVLYNTLMEGLTEVTLFIKVQSGMIAEASADSQYKGIIGSLRKIAAEEGVRGYFKGNAANILRIVPYSAVQFSTYGQFKQVGRSQIYYRSLSK